MRPLARKLFLTQGLVILMVFGVSAFAYLSLRDARDRASRLEAEYGLGKAHQIIEAELRDIERSRKFYFLEKGAQGERLEKMQRSFYDSLARVAVGVDELAVKAARRAELGGLVSQLREQLLDYRRSVAEQEAAARLDAQLEFEAAVTRSEHVRERMRELIRTSGEERDLIVVGEIDTLRFAVQQSAALALFFSGLAVLVGVLATYWLSHSIHRPVRELRSATVALSRGEFDWRIEVRRRDELGDLAMAFNEMAARLQELDELKSGFVAMVSHDLKTPLTSMKEAVDLLADGVGGELTERQKRLLSITREGTERLANYVQGILDLFRFEAGHIRLVKDPLSVAEVVEEQARLMEIRCREAGLTVRCEAEPDLPLVEADRFRLAQVVANLLDNAIKFTPRDGEILVRTRVEPWQDDMAVVMEVSDNGVGIVARDLRHVFDKFFQATRPHGRHVQGAGLGLAIVRNLVEAHGGRVTVRSTVGKGTTFTVLLPAAERLQPGRVMVG